MSPSQRIAYMDWARALAALGVIVLHVFAGVTNHYSADAIGLAREIIWNSVEIPLGRWAVPAFFMISGALLLNPDKELGFKKIGGYIKRMAAILLTFGLLFALMEQVYVSGLSLKSIGLSILHVFEGKSWDHLWYVYSLIGLYILTPALRALVKSASEREYRIVLVVTFVLLLVVPTVNAGLKINLYSFIDLGAPVFYFLAGYYVHRYMELSPKIVVAGVAALVIMIVGVDISLATGNGSAYWLHRPQSCFVAVFAVFVLLWFKRYATAPIEKHRVWDAISRYSFGIYIIHPLFINLQYRVLGLTPLDMLPVVGEVVTFAIALVGSLALTWVCKKLPGFRKWL